MQFIDQALSTGTPDLTPHLPLLIQRLQGMLRAEAACYARAHDPTVVYTLQARAGQLLSLIVDSNDC
jgi:hypothetical protein